MIVVVFSFIFIFRCCFFFRKKQSTKNPWCFEWKLFGGFEFNFLLQEVWSARVPIIKLRFMDIIDVDLSCPSLRFSLGIGCRQVARGRCVDSKIGRNWEKVCCILASSFWHRRAMAAHSWLFLMCIKKTIALGLSWEPCVEATIRRHCRTLIFWDTWHMEKKVVQGFWTQLFFGTGLRESFLELPSCLGWPTRSVFVAQFSTSRSRSVCQVLGQSGASL